jgi:hypothetical protein
MDILGARGSVVALHACSVGFLGCHMGQKAVEVSLAWLKYAFSMLRSCSCLDRLRQRPLGSMRICDGLPYNNPT